MLVSKGCESKSREGNGSKNREIRLTYELGHLGEYRYSQKI